ncbi:hypothetical protein HPB47_006035 [Ixodes persulcatus]|uniref:Uncharacterized protein n=1 Tax=Ixodes persulcatus TaxID=34615 RepID=A0AC60PC74_IXOPE|nr:hypothetical protein HPB47_006035 [Ixodes persulcatus]
MAVREVRSRRECALPVSGTGKGASVRRPADRAYVREGRAIHDRVWPAARRVRHGLDPATLTLPVRPLGIAQRAPGPGGTCLPGDRPPAALQVDAATVPGGPALSGRARPLRGPPFDMAWFGVPRTDKPVYGFEQFSHPGEAARTSSNIRPEEFGASTFPQSTCESQWLRSTDGARPMARLEGKRQSFHLFSGRLNGSTLDRRGTLDVHSSRPRRWRRPGDVGESAAVSGAVSNGRGADALTTRRLSAVESGTHDSPAFVFVPLKLSETHGPLSLSGRRIASHGPR